MTEIWALLKRSPSDLTRVQQVSRGWRRLAAGTPQLWTSPYITESTDADLLSLRLGRANPLPLSVEIDYRRSVNSLSIQGWVITREQIEHFTSLLEVLRSHSARWQSFTVFGPFYVAVLLRRCFDDHTLSIPMLTHISLDLVTTNFEQATGGPPEINSVFQHAPPILAIHTRGYQHFWGNFPFHSLTAITLGRFSPENTLDWNTFAGAASYSTNLLSLAFVGEIPSIAPHHNTSDTLFVLELPELTSLSLTHITSGHLRHLLQHLKVPGLRSLALMLADEDDMFLSFLQAVPAHFPRLETLAMEMLAMDEVAQLALGTFFTPLFHLTTLRLNFDSIPLVLWQALITPANRTDFMPSLREVDFVDVPVHSVQEFVGLRATAGHHIDVVSLHYSSHFPYTPLPPSSTTWLQDNTQAFFISDGDRNISIWM
ncbi:hypothetical protein B0H16DRAFT_1834336 [Mycena metata]|uniref:F-box domain-containing protein n=1 Tax=Mycena metata TaxID=1033252 RepID=A0AAD7DYM0_9AGAR|nr:hypothetical protein B0H16DRAFT_1834336 [Mycena metata]